MSLIPHPGLNWFKEHFMICNEHVGLVRTWLPAQYGGSKAWLDQLVYDRALVLFLCKPSKVESNSFQSRTAAQKGFLVKHIKDR